MLRELMQDTLDVMECNDPRQPVIGRLKEMRDHCAEAKRQVSELTQRQLEVCVLVAKGYADKEIARMYNLSGPSNIYQSRQGAFKKLGITSAAQLVMILFLSGHLGMGEA